VKHLAIALGYPPEANLAPQVLASGEGVLAQRLRQIAKAHGIPCYPDGDLAELLSQVPLAAEIPAELYPAVAEIFAFLYMVGKNAKV